ncbi:glycosyltransferase family 2 protein [Bradyrhizobium sp.]|uniref:glycosyltransferase family 2 protein n=1 Tax=Bradyrhizobium sp. TaxID=376 RepID=UPI0040384712
MTSDSGSVLLTAVIPNFNHGAVLGEAIQALAEQVPGADEIVVVDDASTDNSIEVLERLSLKYPNLRIVQLPRNMGAISALNRGLREARGKYVYFGAADDLTLPGLFEATLAELERHPMAAFASCEVAVVDAETGNRGARPPVRPSYAPAYLAPSDVARVLKRIDNWILTGTAVVRRDLLVEVGGFDAAMGSFADSFVFRRLSLKYGCCFIPQLGLIWRINATGVSRTHVADPVASMQTLDTAIESIKTDPVFPVWYAAVFERRWRFAIGRIAADARPMNRAVLLYLSPGPVSRAVLTGALKLGGAVGRVTALGWLSLRERPTSILGLIRTRLARSRWVRASARSRTGSNAHAVVGTRPISNPDT